MGKISLNVIVCCNSNAWSWLRQGVCGGGFNYHLTCHSWSCRSRRLYSKSIFSLTITMIWKTYLQKIVVLGKYPDAQWSPCNGAHRPRGIGNLYDKVYGAVWGHSTVWVGLSETINIPKKRPCNGGVSVRGLNWWCSDCVRWWSTLQSQGH